MDSITKYIEEYSLDDERGYFKRYTINEYGLTIEEGNYKRSSCPLEYYVEDCLNIPRESLAGLLTCLSDYFEYE